MYVIGKLCRLGQTLRGYRNLHVTHVIRNAYEAPGKTTVTFVSKEIGSRFLVSQCDEFGFVLNNGTRVIGPMVLFPRHALFWNIQSGRQINDASLSLFTVLEPKPDLLVIGLDEQYDFAYIKQIQKCVQKLNIITEIVSVYNACSVFNFVNEEGRYVVAALIPRKSFRKTLKLANSEPMKEITDNNVEDNERDDAKTKSTTK